MQSALPKQFMILGGEPVVARTINTFAEAMPGAEIVVVLPQEHIELWRNLAARFDVAVHRCVAGGSELHKASIPVVEVADSYRRLTAEDSEIVSRSELRIVQTPQIFSAELLRRAYEQEYDPRFTDDASVVEALGHRISLVEGERSNLKLTTPDDLAWAEWWITRE